MLTFDCWYKYAITNHGANAKECKPKQGFLEAAAGFEQLPEACLWPGSILCPQLAAGIGHSRQVSAGCGVYLQMPADQRVHSKHAACGTHAQIAIKD